jgi:hypothetical protein
VGEQGSCPPIWNNSAGREKREVRRRAVSSAHLRAPSLGDCACAVRLQWMTWIKDNVRHRIMIARVRNDRGTSKSGALIDHRAAQTRSGLLVISALEFRSNRGDCVPVRGALI